MIAFVLLLNSAVPLVPADNVDSGLTAWPIVFMMFLVALALVALPIALNWLMDSDFYRPWVQGVMKCIQVILVLSCVGIAFFFPFKVLGNAETPGGVWSLFLGFVLIGVLFGFWVGQFEYYARYAWYGAGAFIGVCFIMAVILSVSLLVSALIAQIVALPAAGLILVALIALVFSSKR